MLVHDQGMGRVESTHVAADHLADGVENHCITCQSAASDSMRADYLDIRSRWISIMDTILAGYGCLRREDAEGCQRLQELEVVRV